MHAGPRALVLGTQAAGGAVTGAALTSAFSGTSKGPFDVEGADFVSLFLEYTKGDETSMSIAMQWGAPIAPAQGSVQDATNPEASYLELANGTVEEASTGVVSVKQKVYTITAADWGAGTTKMVMTIPVLGRNFGFQAKYTGGTGTGKLAVFVAQRKSRG